MRDSCEQRMRDAGGARRNGDSGARVPQVGCAERVRSRVLLVLLALLAALGGAALDLAASAAAAGPALGASAAPALDGRQLAPPVTVPGGATVSAPAHGPGGPGAAVVPAGLSRVGVHPAAWQTATSDDTTTGAAVGAAAGRGPPATTGT